MPPPTAFTTPTRMAGAGPSPNVSDFWTPNAAYAPSPRASITAMGREKWCSNEPKSMPITAAAVMT